MNIQDAIDEKELVKIREVYWGSNSKVLKCLDDMTSSLPSISELISLLNGRYNDGRWNSGMSVSINASRVNLDSTIENLTNIPIYDAINFFNRGYTLCFNDVSHFTPDLKCLKDSGISCFGGGDKALITCYLTPPRSFGILHYDRQHNFFIQREGKKKWTVSEQAAVESPFENLVYPKVTKEFFASMDQQGYQILRPSQCGKVHYELYPNDVLYLPPGFYHVAETEEESSLHFTLTLEPLSFWSEINPHIFSTLISKCKNMNKDIRMLSHEDAKQHIHDCLIELRGSLTEDITEGLMKTHKSNQSPKS